MSHLWNQEETAAATVPMAIRLDLTVEDRDSVEELRRRREGAPRNRYALDALKIGILAMRQASAAFDVDFIQRETDRLLAALRRQLEDHARTAQERVAGSLKEYFDPESGRFSHRVQRLTAEDGDLAQLLRGSLDGDDSRLARTMLAHVGEESPLMKMLSPNQADGLLAALRTNVEFQLSQQREKILREFSLDNVDGALSRLVKELSGKHGDLSKDLQSKIEGVVKEFSLDEENSALSRLVQKVDRAQRTITNEFSLDNEQSALRRMKSELTVILSEHTKSAAEFQEEVKVALAELKTRRETELRSTAHGKPFQDAVFAFLHEEAQRRGDTAADVGDSTGHIKNCKKGDALIVLGPEHAAAGARIVIEAKADASYTVKKACDELEEARKNRGAQQGIFVFSRHTAPPGIDALARYGSDVLVVWDAEEATNDAYFKAALEIARGLCLRDATSSAETIDWAPIDRALNDVEKRARNLGEIRNSASTIKSSSEKILERVRIDQAALDRQVAALREALDDVKRLTGEEG